MTLIIVAGVLIAWSIDAIWSIEFDSDPGVVKTISLTVTILTFISSFLLERTWRRIWAKFPFIGLRTFPDLNGVWKGTLISTWVDPATGEMPAAISAEIRIRQGLFATHISMATAESKSHSRRSFLESFYETRCFRIWYSYNNDPQARVRRRSSPHEGVAYLELDYDANPRRLTGRYYTARKTTGDIDVEKMQDCA